MMIRPMISAAALVLAACTASTTSAPSTDPGSSSAPPAEEATSPATPSTPAAPPPAAQPAHDPPAPLPPFELVIDGAARTLVSVAAENVGVGGASTCTRRLRLNATLAAVGDERADVPPTITLSLCASALPASGDVAFGSDDDVDADLRFHFQRPGAAYFPLAEGPGVHVVRSGTDGWFEASASGTFELSQGVHAPFTLKFRQAVPAVK